MDNDEKKIDAAGDGVRAVAVRELGSSGDGAAASAQPVSVVNSLRLEGEAARVLLLNLRDILADDAEATADAVEGETNLMEAIDAALGRIAELETHAKAIKDHVEALRARSVRFEHQSDLIRAALVSAVSMAGLRKIERPTATISLRAIAPSLRITQEADIPSDYWVSQAPKLDKRAVVDALKTGIVVPGAELSNGGETISIRTK